MKFKKVVKYFSFILLAYIGLHFIMYALQERFIFLETELHAEHNFNFRADFEEHFLEHENGEKINALLFNPADTSKGTILYFHGNSRNLQRWGHMANSFLVRGYQVLMIDYRGYGKSDGEPSEANLKADGQLAYDWIKNNFPDQAIIIYGRSLGTGVASYVAGHNPAQKLILETPFNNMTDVAKSRYPFLFLPYPLRVQFPSDEYLQKVDYPIYIFHGTADRVIPFTAAEKLKDILKPEDKFYTVENGRHNNLNNFPEVKNAFDSILQ